MPDSIHGTYARQKGLKRRYYYQATVIPKCMGFDWQAIVQFEGALKGQLNGAVETNSFEHSDVIVGSYVEGSIENLIKVEE